MHIRTAIIGFGSAGSLHWGAIQEHLLGEVAVTAICEPNKDFLKVLEEKRALGEAWTGGHTREVIFKGAAPALYSNWNALLRREKPEMITIATPSALHAQSIIDAARAGVKWIFCEKPISNCLRAGQEAVEVCRKLGVILAVNHTRRFWLEYRQGRGFIQNRAIGDIRSIAVSCGGARSGDILVHFTDWLRFMTNSNVVRVTGFLDPVTEPNPRDKTGEKGIKDPPCYG